MPIFVGQGWDNSCFLYPSRRIVFRFPTRQVGADLVPVERAALPVVASHVSLAVPEPLYFAEASPEFPFPFTGFRFIAGVTADSLLWQPDDLFRAAGVMGSFLKELHSIDIDQPALAEAGFDTMGKVDPPGLLRKAAPRKAQIIGKRPDLAGLVMEGFALFESMAAECEPGTPGPLVLAHGDLYPRHVLVDERFAISGVIDWGDVHKGSAASDLSLGWTMFDETARAELWCCYGKEPSGELARRAKLRALMYGFSLLAYGLDVGDGAATNMGGKAILNVLADPQ